MDKCSLSLAPTAPPSPAPATLIYVGLAVTVCCWGVLPVFSKQLLHVFNALELTFVRFFLSGLLLLVMVLATQPHALIGAVRRNPRGILASSILGPVLFMAAQNFGIQTVGIGVTAVIIALQPILTYLIAVTMGQEQGSLPRTLSILLCVGGLTMIVAAEGVVGDSFWFGLCAACLAPLIWAINTVISKDLVAKESPLVLVTANLLISSVGLLPFLSGDLLAKLGAISAADGAAMAFCVLPATVLGFAFWYGSLRLLAPSTLSVSVFAIPVISLIGGVAVFGEPLTVLKSVGAALVLYGLYLVNVKYKQAQRQPATV
jgi:drug/metabolite transporter (DMT)-like permease